RGDGSTPARVPPEGPGKTPRPAEPRPGEPSSSGSPRSAGRRRGSSLPVQDPGPELRRDEPRTVLRVMTPEAGVEAADGGPGPERRRHVGLRRSVAAFAPDPSQRGGGGGGAEASGS